MKLRLLIKTKMLKNLDFSCLKFSGAVFTLLMNVKMPPIVVGMLAFLSVIISLPSRVEHYNLDARQRHMQIDASVVFN